MAAKFSDSSYISKSVEQAAVNLLADEIEVNTNTSAQTLKDEAEETEAILQSLDGQYLIIDICANLTNKKFARDVDGVIQRAKDAGVKKIIVAATNIQSSKEALRLTRLFPNSVYCTAGVHPHDAKIWTKEMVATLREITSNQECVAIGQCGLDFNKNFSEPEDQIKVFETQVQLACELKKPLFIFERDAHNDVVTILSRYSDNLPVTVLHSFTGNREQLQKYISLGCYIGLTGYIWKDKSDDGVRKMLEDGLIPLDRLLVETDSPFMYPNTRATQIPSHVKHSLSEKSLSFLHRYCTFQRNEPCSLPVTVEMIAAYFKIRPDDVALKTTYSALKIFGLN